MKNIVSFGVIGYFFLSTVYAHEASVSKPDDHAPLGVSGDHLHKKGSFMIGYKFDRKSSDGLLDGTKEVSPADIVNSGRYGEIHTDMTMDMHMLDIMYGVTDDLTLMVMPQYMQMDMTHFTTHGGGHQHAHKTEGFGDTQVVALYSLVNQNHSNGSHKLHANLGVSVPTGAYNETFRDHHNTLYPMPYDMQFGTGTYDPIVGLTYTGTSGDWSWGAQTLNEIRVYENDDNWRAGNKYNLTFWGARNITDFASLSLRLDGEARDDVSGRHPNLPITAIGGANPDETGYRRVDANVGLNFLVPTGVLAGNRLGVEFGMPVYVRTDGAQLKRDYRVTAGWQYAF